MRNLGCARPKLAVSRQLNNVGLDGLPEVRLAVSVLRRGTSSYSLPGMYLINPFVKLRVRRVQMDTWKTHSSA